MADLDKKDSSASTKLVGANSAGAESNFAEVTVNADLQTADLLQGAGVQGTLTIGTTAVELKVGASVLANRKAAGLTNTSNNTIYWGYTNAVTTANGRPLQKNVDADWEISDSASIWLIAASAGNVIKVNESA